MSPIQGIKLIKQMKRLGVSKLMFSGGEPLLRKDILKLVRFAHKQGMHTDLVTNGTLIDGNTAKKLGESGLCETSLSLDGVKDETHDRLRGRSGAFRKTVAAIGFLTDQGIKVDIICVPTKINVDEIGTVIDLVSGLSVSAITLAGLVLEGKAVKFRKMLELDREETSKLYDTIKSKREEYGPAFPIRTIGLVKHAPLERCPAGTSILAVDSSGFVHPCIQLKINRSQQHCIKRTSLSDIWLSRDFEDIRALIQNPLVCDVECSLRSVCGKGCRGLAERYYSNIFAPDPLCSVPSLR